MNLAAILTFLKQSDKQMHALGCYCLTITLLLVLPMPRAAPIVLAVGFAKERLFDWYRPAAHTADWLDFVADAIGVGLACLVFIVAPLIIQAAPLLKNYF